MENTQLKMREKERPKSCVFHQAVATGDSEAVKKMLSQGVDVDVVFTVDEEIKQEVSKRKSMASMLSREDMIQEESEDCSGKVEASEEKHDGETEDGSVKRKKISDGEAAKSDIEGEEESCAQYENDEQISTTEDNENVENNALEGESDSSQDNNSTNETRDILANTEVEENIDDEEFWNNKECHAEDDSDFDEDTSVENDSGIGDHGNDDEEEKKGEFCEEIEEGEDVEKCSSEDNKKCGSEDVKGCSREDIKDFTSENIEDILKSDQATVVETKEIQEVGPAKVIESPNEDKEEVENNVQAVEVTSDVESNVQAIEVTSDVESNVQAVGEEEQATRDVESNVQAIEVTGDVERRLEPLKSSSMKNEETQRKRKSLADCIEERLQDNNQSLVERTTSLGDKPANSKAESSTKLLPLLKKKISFKRSKKVTVEKKRSAAEETDDDDMDVFNKPPRNVDSEQLDENYQGVAFFDAVRGGMEMTVQVLLETSDNHQLNHPDDSGHTPVMQACWHGQTDCLKILLQHGANVDLRTAAGCTGAHFAAGRGHLGCVQLLVDYEPECIHARTKFGATPLILAAKEGHTETVECLLRSGADVNATYRGQQNALLFSAGNGHYDCIEHLIKYKVNVDQANSQGVTPLMRAVQQGHNDCVELLVARNANLDVQDAHGRTAVHFAVEGGNKTALKGLLNAGAHYDVKSHGNSTPLAYAERLESKSCQSLLINHINVVRECEASERDLALSQQKEKRVTCVNLSQLFRRSKRGAKST